MKSRIFFTVVTVLFITLSGCKDKKHTEVLKESKRSIKELKSIVIDDYKFNYLDIGKGDPVVFVHGSIGDYRAWTTQLDTFATKYRVIAYSRRYAWPNAQPVSDTLDYSAGQHAKDLAQLIQTLDLGPSNLVGHSWGGYTVLKTAIDHPELVKSMVLGEPAASIMVAGTTEGDSLLRNFYETIIAPASKSFAEQKPQEAIQYFVNGVMGDSTYYDSAAQEIRDIWMQNTAETEGSILQTNSWTPIGSDQAGALQMPVLLLNGNRSPELFVKVVDTLQSLIPDAKRFQLPNSSHGLQLENPEGFNNAVLDFLNKN